MGIFGHQHLSPWLLLFLLNINYAPSLTTQFSYFISDQQQLFKLYTILYTVLSLDINPLTPELNPSAQRCLPRYLLGILLLEPRISIICVKIQQMQQLFNQLINYVW
jgi:hypothetical protein